MVNWEDDLCYSYQLKLTYEQLTPTYLRQRLWVKRCSMLGDRGMISLMPHGLNQHHSFSP